MKTEEQIRTEIRRQLNLLKMEPSSMLVNREYIRALKWVLQAESPEVPDSKGAA